MISFFVSARPLFLAGLVVIATAHAALSSNTAILLVADVTNTTQANDAFWAEKCKIIPEAAALFIQIKMGGGVNGVIDYFKPREDWRRNFCEMLQAKDEHQWSANGVDWMAVDFQPDELNNGGSEMNWPRDKGVEGDERRFLSTWGYDGDDGSLTGGCCSSSTAAAVTQTSLPGNGDNTAWGHPFTLSCVVQLQPPPPNTGMSLVAAVPGTTVANDAFWAEPCKLIPSTARGITVDMGAVSVVVCPVCARAFEHPPSCPLAQDITAPFSYPCACFLDNNGFVSRVSCRRGRRGASQSQWQCPDTQPRARSTKMLTCSDDTN